MPAIGAGVWIEFEGGNPDFPIWTGCWWGNTGGYRQHFSFASLRAIETRLPDAPGEITGVRFSSRLERMLASEAVMLHHPVLKKLWRARHAEARLLSWETEAVLTDWRIDPLAASAPHIKSGSLRALAVSTPQRYPAFPDVPTMDELGLKGFDSTAWYGLLGPAGLPHDGHDPLRDVLGGERRHPGAARRHALRRDGLPHARREAGRADRSQRVAAGSPGGPAAQP